MQRITEAQLRTVKLQNVEGVQLVRPGEVVGVSVALPHRADHVVRPGDKPPATLAELLLIEVQDPEDASTMSRVRAALGLDEASPAS